MAHMGQSLTGLVSAIMSSWGHDTSVDMLLADSIHPGSHGLTSIIGTAGPYLGWAIGPT